MARTRSAVAEPPPELPVPEQERLEHEDAVEHKVEMTVELDPSMTIYERMVAIIRDLPAIGKDTENTQQHFMFRSYDAMMNALNPLLWKHGVFIVPKVIERITDQRPTRNGGVMYEVNLHVQYTFYGACGDTLVATAWGEGTDSGDKSTNKAMTMALKNVIAQAFAVSTKDMTDSDSTTDPETTGRSSSHPVVAVDPKPTVPPNWSEALKRFDNLLGSNGEGAAWLEELIEKLYGETSVGNLDKEHKQVVWVGFCSTLMLLEERYGDLALTPAVRGLIQSAFLEKCKPLRDAGIALEGPAWAMDPTEAETRPQRGTAAVVTPAAEEEKAE